VGDHRAGSVRGLSPLAYNAQHSTISALYGLSGWLCGRAVPAAKIHSGKAKFGEITDEQAESFHHGSSVANPHVYCCLCGIRRRFGPDGAVI